MNKGGGRAIGRGHRRIGVMACVACSREIPVKVTPGEKLSCQCTWCDLPLYVNPGTEAHRLIMAKVKLDQAPAPATDPGQPASGAAAPPAAAPAGGDKGSPAKPPPRSFAGPLFGG